MSNVRAIHARTSRREVLLGSALAASALVSARATSPAQAQQKLTQAEAQYQPTPKGEMRCKACASFRAPKACRFVQGDIGPDGWCALFTL